MQRCVQQVRQGRERRHLRLGATRHAAMRALTFPPSLHASLLPHASAPSFPAVLFSLSAVAPPAAMGQDPTDEELFDMIAEVDADGSGEIGERPVGMTLPPLPPPPPSPISISSDFSEFLRVIVAQKAKIAGQDDESDTGVASSPGGRGPRSPLPPSQWTRSSLWAEIRIKLGKSQPTSCAQ